jgi:hypothetical protein
MERKTKIKIVFNSKSNGLIEIEEELGNDNLDNRVIKNINTSLGVSSFPTSELEITPNSNYPKLISIKTEDEVEIYATENNQPFNKIFHGILSSVTVKAEKEKFELLMEAISPFYLLQKRKISFQNFKNKEGLREVLNELIELSGINGRIEVDKDISNQFILTAFKSFPALSLINAICYDLDLVYDFNSGEIMTISNRKTILNKMHTSIPIVIDNDKIISSEFKQ